MSYNSIDEVQRFMAESIFERTKDPKKSAGRALGTFVEIITYYLLKSWGFQKNMAIETRLPEFGGSDLTHNVEFTLHKLRSLKSIVVDGNASLSSSAAVKELKLNDTEFTVSSSKKIIDTSHGSSCIKNGAIIGQSPKYMYAAYIDSLKHTCKCSKLDRSAFAMFECKRVGKEGDSKGPQTIEKAKQGAYVARTVSALQRVKTADGEMKGLIICEDRKYILDDYYKLLDRVISGDLRGLYGFVLTVGVVSNHGNWFTSDNPNKEIKVLQQAYDWLLFLSDDGLTKFVGRILSDAMPSCRAAFTSSYSVNSVTQKKNVNTFTKSFIDYEADVELTKYFTDSADEILSWFNILSPDGGSIGSLKKILLNLAGDDNDSRKN